MLNSTQPHFIKCVKPNNVKRNVFDSNFTLYQLSYLGLLEVIRIRKSGYPVRMLGKDGVPTCDPCFTLAATLLHLCVCCIRHTVEKDPT